MNGRERQVRRGMNERCASTAWVNRRVHLLPMPSRFYREITDRVAVAATPKLTANMSVSQNGTTGADSQGVKAFLLRQGRRYPGRAGWTLPYRRVSLEALIRREHN